jgi:hypothetical protein
LIIVATPALAQRNGDLIAADPVAQAPDDMRAWRIRYWTTDDRGGPRQVSGMVVAPRGERRSTDRPVIAWTHGTWGGVQQCAPSQSSQFFDLTPALGAVRNGYVVVAPDYPGLGSPGPHPYFIGAVPACATLNAVQAARNPSGGSRERLCWRMRPERLQDDLMTRGKLTLCFLRLPTNHQGG